jgi:hypothetical protein
MRHVVSYPHNAIVVFISMDNLMKWQLCSWHLSMKEGVFYHKIKSNHLLCNGITTAKIFLTYENDISLCPHIMLIDSISFHEVLIYLV